MSHPTGYALAANDAVVEAVTQAVSDEYGSRLCYDRDSMSMVKFCHTGPCCRCREIARAAIAAYEAVIAKLDMGT